MSRSIIASDIVLTMKADHPAIQNGAVCIDGDRIAAVGTLEAVRAQFPETPIRHMRQRMLMPGLVNGHCHSGLLRGTAEGLPLWDWLRLYIDPMHRVLQPQEAEIASLLCYAEALLSGTTTLVDMWRFMDGSARAAETIGNRLVAGPYVGAHPDYNYFDTIDDNGRMLEAWAGKADGRIDVGVGLEHLFYPDEAGQRGAIDRARRYRTGFHTHS